MAPDNVDGAVRRVLPRLNFAPASFELDRGLLAGARRRAKPSVLALEEFANQRVFVGIIPTTDPDTVAERVAGEGLTALRDSSRRACERMIVAWGGSSWHPRGLAVGRGRMTSQACQAVGLPKLRSPLEASTRPDSVAPRTFACALSLQLCVLHLADTPSCLVSDSPWRAAAGRPGVVCVHLALRGSQ